MTRAISTGWPGFIKKCRSIFLTRRTGPGKPGKSWNFIMAFSRTRKSWKRATGPGKFWKLLLKTQLKNIKCMERSKENWHWDLGRVGVNVNFRAFEKSIWVLEKSWKFVFEKGYKPCPQVYPLISDRSVWHNGKHSQFFFSFLLCQNDVKYHWSKT